MALFQSWGGRVWKSVKICHIKAEMPVRTLAIKLGTTPFLSKCTLTNIMIIIIIVGFIQRKIDTSPLMRLGPRRESPGTGMGRHLKSAKQCKPKLHILYTV